jgi:hypothetical protein
LGWKPILRRNKPSGAGQKSFKPEMPQWPRFEKLAVLFRTKGAFLVCLRHKVASPPIEASSNRQNNIILAVKNGTTDDISAYMAMGNQELAKQIADRIRQVRLAHNWSLKEVAARSEVPIATYRLFETTGRISLERLLRVATALHRVRDFENFLAPLPIRSIDDLVDKRPVRKRGRSVTV